MKKIRIYNATLAVLRDVLASFNSETYMYSIHTAECGTLFDIVVENPNTEYIEICRDFENKKYQIRVRTNDESYGDWCYIDFDNVSEVL